MMPQSNKIVLIKDTRHGLYYYKDESCHNDESVLLWLFFTSCLGYDSSRISLIKKWIDQGLVGCNDLHATIIDGKFQFYHDLIEGLKEPRLTKQELLALVDKWYELVTVKVDKIIIIHDDGKFTLSAG